MGSTQQLLEELREQVTDDVHLKLITAYQDDQSYEALVQACTDHIEAKIREVDTAHDPGDPGLQRHPDD